MPGGQRPVSVPDGDRRASSPGRAAGPGIPGRDSGPSLDRAVPGPKASGTDGRVVVLGAVVAAVIPLIMAVVAIVVALGLASLAGQAFELSFFVENMITMIGLAVGIDYSLFVVSRYREERVKGLDKLEAIARAGATANRTVVFSGITVVLGFIGMLLVPSNVFIGIGLAVIFVVVASVLAAMTLLPAIISLLGDNLNRFAVPIIGKAQINFDESRSGGIWDKLSRAVMGQPVISLVLAGGLLITAVVFFFDIRTGASGVSSFPDGIESKAPGLQPPT